MARTPRARSVTRARSAARRCGPGTSTPPARRSSMPDTGAHRVTVIGGGFGGLQAALALRHAPVEVTLVDRRNFHLFQPLTYQVATGALAPGEIAYPLRAIFKSHSNVRVMLAEVSAVDLGRREVRLGAVGRVPAPEALSYDTLIVAG